MKKFLYTACLVAVFFGIIPAKAQQVGDWKYYQVFAGKNVKSIIDTGKRIYYLSDGWLYAYDKDNDETLFFNKRNDLSDTDITNIYYNYDKKYLLVTYANSNIDLLLDDGKTVNIPDLKNTVMTVSKAINDVSFLGNEIFMATDFGYMVLNDDKYYVKEAFNYGKKMITIAATSKYIYAGFDDKLWVTTQSEPHFSISSFKETNFKQRLDLVDVVDDNTLFGATGWSYGLQINDDNPENVGIWTVAQKRGLQMTRTKTGFMVSYSGGTYETYDGDLKRQSEVKLPDDLKSCMVTSMESDGSVWGIDKYGIKQFKIDGGSITYLHENYRPNATSVSSPYYMKYANNRLYEMNSGPNGRNDGGGFADGGLGFELAILSGGEWKNLEAPSYKNLVNTQTISDPFSLAVDTKDPDAVWFGSWREGILCLKNNEQIQKFDYTNSPMTKGRICMVPAIIFDSKGNLWSMYCYEGSNFFMSLPADKVYAQNVAISDWQVYNLRGFTPVKRAIMINTRSDVKVFTNGGAALYALDPKGTLDPSDDVYNYTTEFVDQDGKTMEIGFIYNILEDLDGRLWFSTANGVFTLPSVRSLFSSNITINRVKIPRNDGTNLADYLLDGLSVVTAAVDGANRKWFGTTDSGLYLVSADGTQILQHFTTDNSYLPDNSVLSVECSTDDNTVYVGTNKGTVAYSSDAAPSSDSYSNVYAYPNPVRPDYTGYVTITGLKENSLVKSADAAGNVLFSKISTGGMAIWDACNSDGTRVSTGVYFVFASQNGEGGSSGDCVAKIMVVR